MNDRYREEYLALQRCDFVKVGDANKNNLRDSTGLNDYPHRLILHALYHYLISCEFVGNANEIMRNYKHQLNNAVHVELLTYNVIFGDENKPVNREQFKQLAKLVSGDLRLPLAQG